jgi:hypothetical protein
MVGGAIGLLSGLAATGAESFSPRSCCSPDGRVPAARPTASTARRIADEPLPRRRRPDRSRPTRRQAYAGAGRQARPSGLWRPSCGPSARCHCRDNYHARRYAASGVHLSPRPRFSRNRRKYLQRIRDRFGPPISSLTFINVACRSFCPVKKEREQGRTAAESRRYFLQNPAAPRPAQTQAIVNQC